jgi:hypothetical protein
MEEGRSAFKMLTYKPTIKRSLERPGRRLEENIVMDLKGTRNWNNSVRDMDYLTVVVKAELNHKSWS